MVVLEGLNKRQRAIAELLWNCETEERAKEMLKALSDRDRNDGVSIMHMMIQEVLEERVNDEFYVQAAEAVIAAARDR